MAKRKTVTKKPKNAKPDQYFVLVTGNPLKNLKELAFALDTMPDWVFEHHVNDHKNDFCSWIDSVLKEPELAKDMVEARTRISTQTKVLKYLIKKYL